MTLAKIFVLTLVLATSAAVDPASAADAQVRVFEIRTYTSPAGKLDELHQRFRKHTLKIFERHGMTNIVYLTPQDPALARTTLVYLLSHKSRQAAAESWAAFNKDPEWQKVKAASEANGPIVSKVESVFLDATDYSPIK